MAQSGELGGIDMKTVIGVDFGTREARALLADAETGTVLRSAAVRYPHGVMPGDLADIGDYDDALAALLEAMAAPEYRRSIAGICVDATSLTLVPLAGDGRVLCRVPGFESAEQAQVKLWKRHAAQPQADEAQALARAMDMPFLGRTGGVISSEWSLPKLLEMRDKAPELYRETDLAPDMSEYMTLCLTGRLTRAVGSLGYKGLWFDDLGFPEARYLDALRPGFAGEYAHLMRGTRLRPGERAGTLCDAWMKRLGLEQPVAVACGAIDAHTGMSALGAFGEGDVALIVGTSNVVCIQAGALREIGGICGIVHDGMAPGLYGIEAGQNCAGDMLEWYVRNAVPAQVAREAEDRDVSVHQVLCERVREPWRCGVSVADWWNGSRSAPCDLKLTGRISGLTLATRPEDLYLGLLQGIVCGTRSILELCEGAGLPVKRVVATGGMAQKNPLLMGQYANLLHCEIAVGDMAEGPALGAAIHAAVAAGIHPTLAEAHAHMGVRRFTVYRPEPERAEAYEALYQRNRELREER